MIRDRVIVYKCIWQHTWQHLSWRSPRATPTHRWRDDCAPLHLSLI